MIENISANWLVIKPHNLEKIGNLWIPDNANKDMLSFSGTIKSMCKSLRYQDGTNHTMLWDVDIELKVGDTVWYNPLCNIEAQPRSKQNHYGEARGFEEDGEYFMFVHYQDIFVAKRGDDIICPNGFILAEPVKDFKDSKIILINGQKSFKNRCIIRHLGNPVKEYKFGKEEGVPIDDLSIKSGDEVLITPNGGILLDEARKEIDGGKSFYRFRRQDIIAKIIDNKLSPVSDRVLIKEDSPEEILPSGLILPKTELRGDGRYGTVVGYGGLCRNTQLGSRVFYQHSKSIDVVFNEEEYKMTREPMILAN